MVHKPVFLHGHEWTLAETGAHEVTAAVLVLQNLISAALRMPLEGKWNWALRLRLGNSIEAHELGFGS